jgi:hypothetical protein
VSIALAGALSLGLVVRFGPPSVSLARRTVDARFGTRTAEILDAQCTHMVGNYYKVWPGMFHANLTRYERGETRKVWALSNRALETKPYWSQVEPKHLRICATEEGEDDRELARYWLDQYGFSSLVVIERREKMVIWGTPQE